jgi:hypothetical protein
MHGHEHDRDEVMLGQDGMDAAQERRWRRWVSGRCYCVYPIPVSDPSRRPPHCQRCGGYIPVPVIDTETDAKTIDVLERENCILYIAFIIMTAIAAVAVYLYDKAVTTTIAGGTQ